MDFETTDTENDTIVISRETFEQFFGEAPIKDNTQKYFDGFAVHVSDVCNYSETVSLQSTYGLNFIEEYF